MSFDPADPFGDGVPFGLPVGPAPDGFRRLTVDEFKPIEFVDRPLLQANAFHLLVGRKAVGKGTWLAGVAAAFSRGEFGGSRNVLWIGSEDDPQSDVGPRLHVAGADLERVNFIRDWLQLPQDVNKIVSAASHLGAAGLIVIDPLSNHLGRRDGNSVSEVRDGIARLNPLAAELGTVVIGVHHLTEKESSRGIIAAVLGSSAWTQTARVVLAAVADNENAGELHVQCIVGNRVQQGTHGRHYRLEGVDVPWGGEPIVRTMLIGDSTQEAETTFAESTPTRGAKRANAKEIVLESLAVEPKAMTLLKAAGMAAGISGETIWRAANELRAEGVVDCHGGGPGNPFVWFMTGKGSPTARAYSAEMTKLVSTENPFIHADGVQASSIAVSTRARGEVTNLVSTNGSHPQQPLSIPFQGGLWQAQEES